MSCLATDPLNGKIKTAGERKQSMRYRETYANRERIMRLSPIGDYYEWYCDWCDSKNLTLWTRFEKGEVVCGACHKNIMGAIPSVN